MWRLARLLHQRLTAALLDTKALAPSSAISPACAAPWPSRRDDEHPSSRRYL